MMSTSLALMATCTAPPSNLVVFSRSPPSFCSAFTHCGGVRPRWCTATLAPCGDVRPHRAMCSSQRHSCTVVHVYLLLRPWTCSPPRCTAVPVACTVLVCCMVQSIYFLECLFCQLYCAPWRRDASGERPQVQCSSPRRDMPRRVDVERGEKRFDEWAEVAHEPHDGGAKHANHAAFDLFARGGRLRAIKGYGRTDW
jgi:hypothetical protein